MIALLLAAAVASGDPAHPQAPDQDTSKSAPKRAAADPNKVVCRYEEVAGQRIPTRICMTRAQWTAQDEKMEQFFQQQRDAGAIAQPSGPPATGVP